MIKYEGTVEKGYIILIISKMKGKKYGNLGLKFLPIVVLGCSVLEVTTSMSTSIIQILSNDLVNHHAA